MFSDPSPRMTLCLAIDLKKSTATGLRLTTKRLDRFNLALVNQLGPHLQAVGLDNTLIKFTGDGWLIVSEEPEHAAPLCCLAVIMACRFQAEIGPEASLAPEKVPALRLAVCWGRDIPVALPDGKRDYVGDSVRHAVRACQFCHDNEILIDDTVHRWVHHDFKTARLNLQARQEEFPTAKMEEELTLHVLEELKIESGQDVDAPVYFVNTLQIIGRDVEAQDLAEQISARLRKEAEEPDANQAELRETLNQLLASNLDYETLSRYLRELREAGLRLDVSTYNLLIARSTDTEDRKRWFERMKSEQIVPDIRTYQVLIGQTEDEATVRKYLAQMKKQGVAPDTTLLNTVITRSPDHATASAWFDRLLKEGIAPNAETYKLLIAKATTVSEARTWVDRMLAAGIRAGLDVYYAMFAPNKDIASLTAEDLLQWYLKLEHHPADPMKTAIAEFRRAGKLEDALRLCLDYPYTDAARKMIREHPETALAYFHGIVETTPNHANGTYALGIALNVVGRNDEAETWLRKAFELAGPGPRREEITRYIDRIRRTTTMVLA